MASCSYSYSLLLLLLFCFYYFSFSLLFLLLLLLPLPFLSSSLPLFTKRLRYRGSTLMTSCNFHHFTKAPPLNFNHGWILLLYLSYFTMGVQFQHTSLEGRTPIISKPQHTVKGRKGLERVLPAERKIKGRKGLCPARGGTKFARRY